MKYQREEINMFYFAEYISRYNYIHVLYTLFNHAMLPTRAG